MLTVMKIPASVPRALAVAALALTSFSPLRGAETAAGATAEPPPVDVSDTFGEVISVSLTYFRARVVDASGRPVPGLGPQDFEMKVGDKPVPLTSVDWYADSVTPASDDDPDAALAEPSPAAAEVAPHRVSTRGTLYLFFVESEPGRGMGGSPSARQELFAAIGDFLAALPADAWVAVVSRDGRLHLALDFTPDRAATLEAVRRAARGQEPPAADAPAAAGLRLRAHWSEARAAEASTSEAALFETARALRPLPGEKAVVYLRLGPGAFSPGADSPELLAAIRAFQGARASLFVVDARRGGTIARDSLQRLVLSTGGSYVAARTTPQSKLRQLARTLGGYYLMTLDPEELPRVETPQKVTVRLREKRKGEVLMVPLWARSAGPSGADRRPRH